MQWKKALQLKNLPENTGTRVRLGEHRIAVFRVGSQYYATQDACPHRGAPLGDGPLEGTVVTCTWHGWEFDVKKGCHVYDPDVSLKTYPTKIKGNFLFVGLSKEQPSP